MLFQELHRELIRNHINNPRDEDELLLWMMLLHTHKVVLADIRLCDDCHVDFIHGATHRAAAEAIANLWPDQNDERAFYVYWYQKYLHVYAGAGSVPTERAAEIDVLRKRLESDPRVKSVTVDQD